MTRLGREWINTTVFEGSTLPDDVVNAADKLNLLETVDEFFSLVSDDDEENAIEMFNDEIVPYLEQMAPRNCYFGIHPDVHDRWGFWRALATKIVD